MAKKKESSEVTKQKIIMAARALFAQRGIEGVGIREIADKVGINHALIIRYFGSKTNLAAEILEREVREFYRLINPNLIENTDRFSDVLREKFLQVLSDPEIKTMIQIIVRAEMEGSHPERLLVGGTDRTIFRMANYFEKRNESGNSEKARLFAVIVAGVMMALVTVPQWLFSATGLPADEHDRHFENLVDIMVKLVLHSKELTVKTPSNLV